MSNLTAYTPVPENSAATPGLFDFRYQTLHANVQAVDATASQISTYVSQVSLTVSSVSGSGISGFVNVALAPYNAKGDGTTDDRAAFVSANSSTATQNILYVPSVASVYKIASSMTVQGLYSPIPGAVVRPSSGQTFYVAGTVNAGSHQWIDGTAGGNAYFTKQRTFRPEWFGVKGDGSTDDLSALSFMFANIPDYSTVLLSVNLQMVISDELIVRARRGITIKSEVPNLPDGQGPQLIWSGPSAILSGSDAAISNGSSVLTTSTGKFQSFMSGQRILVAFAGPSGGGLFAKIASYQSSTQVTLDTVASANQSSRSYLIGPAMLYFQSCDHPTVTGLSIRLATTECHGGYDAYIASGSTQLNLKAFGNLSSSDIGKMIRVDGIGPGGIDLYTTVATVSGSLGGAQVIGLSASASSSIASNVLTTYVVGRTATSLPARYGILSDDAGINSVTGTGNVFRDNHITVPNPIDYEWYGIAVAMATQSNQEYGHVEHNAILGGGTLDMQGDGFTSGISTTASSTTVSASGSYFAPAHTGRRIRIPNAGPGGGLYDAKIITVVDGQHAITSASVSSGVTNERLFLGECRSYGFVIGGSPNAKGHTLRHRNVLNGHKWGLWLQNGSVHATDTSWTGCEAAIRIDGTSEPCHFDFDNDEQSLKHLDAQSHADPLKFTCPRVGNLFMTPNGAYWHQDQNSGVLILEAPKHDNSVYTGSTMHHLTSSNNRLRLIEPEYYNAPNPTLSQLGISQSQVETATTWVSVEGHHTISDAPADIFTVGSLGGGTPAGGAHGSFYIGGIARLANGHSYGTPRSVSGSITLDLRDGVVKVDATASVRTITLPSPSLCPCVRIIKTDASSNTVVIQDGASGTINGAATSTLTTQYAKATLVSDGTNWLLF